ncbi:MAG: HlyC/CorC family transporter [Planctomycetes bacterium]|nr:HlyC/CorC family transporter [Planctomycetota bacterium]
MIGSLEVEWIAAGLLLCASAFLSGSETSLFALSLEQRERTSERVKHLLRDPQALLVTVLLLNLVANILFFAVVSGIAPQGEAYQKLVWAALALFAVVFLGEIVPKAIALQRAAKVARLVALPIQTLVLLSRPVRRLVQGVLQLALRALGDVAREEPPITNESLAEVLEQSAGHGLIGVGEADLLAEVVELEGLRVGEIMTPRVDLLSLDLDASEDDNLQIVARALARRQTWLAAIRGQADDLVGIVRLRDLLREGDTPLSSLVKPALFVPEVASVLDLLKQMREHKATEAIVIDEYGGTAGAVTIEAVFEEIVGDLRVEGEAQDAPVVALGGGRFRVSGSLSIRDWNEQFGRRVVPEGFETVGGFVTALLGRIPRAGDRVRAHGLVTQVREVRGRRVASVDLYIEGSQGGPS